MAHLKTKQFVEDPTFFSDWLKARELRRMVLEGKPVNKDRLREAGNTTKETTKILQAWTAEKGIFVLSLANARKDETTRKALVEEGFIPEGNK